jgi:hypothetical protein
MLPDLRIVIAAVISTFVLTVGVGFYASSRLIHEPKKRTDSLAALDETPVNRIALSWPEPTRQPDQPALDFAVTAKALRNPVRDVTNDTHKPVQESAAKPQVAERVEIARPAPHRDASVKVDILAPVAPAELAPPSAIPTVANPKPVLDAQLDIRVAVQYPPITELPPELTAPETAPIAAAPAVATPREPQQESPVTTGSIVATPAASDAAAPERTKPEPQIASRPDEIRQDVQLPEPPKPAPKAARKKAAPKKAAAATAKRPVKTVRRAARPATPATTAFPIFWGGTLR